MRQRYHEPVQHLVVERRRRALLADRGGHRQCGRDHDVGGAQRDGDASGESGADGVAHRTGQRRDLHRAGDEITVSANASDSDGTIAKVDFFAGPTLIAALTPPARTASTGQTSVPARTADRGGHG